MRERSCRLRVQANSVSLKVGKSTVCYARGLLLSTHLVDTPSPLGIDTIFLNLTVCGRP